MELKQAFKFKTTSLNALNTVSIFSFDSVLFVKCKHSNGIVYIVYSI
jgi:hypothetical protein